MQPRSANPEPERAWHALPVEEAVAAVASDHAEGLSGGEARARLDRYGRNELPEHESRSLLAVFAGQFKSPLIYLLLLAALIALALGHRSDAGVIFTVVLLNSLIGTLQEGRAERATCDMSLT